MGRWVGRQAGRQAPPRCPGPCLLSQEKKAAQEALARPAVLVACRRPFWGLSADRAGTWWRMAGEGGAVSWTDTTPGNRAMHMPHPGAVLPSCRPTARPATPTWLGEESFGRGRAACADGPDAGRLWDHLAGLVGAGVDAGAGGAVRALDCSRAGGFHDAPIQGVQGPAGKREAGTGGRDR